MSLPSSTLLEALPGRIVFARSRACAFDVSRGDGNLAEVRIAEEARAIEERASHRLGDQVHRLDRAARLLLNLERLEHVQHLDQRHAARARRRHRDDVVAEERALDRRALLRAIAGEIGFADQAAVCRHVLGDAIGDPAGVERVRPVGRDRLEASRPDPAERCRSPAAHAPPPGLPYAATEAGKRCIGPPSRTLVVEPARERRRHREALLRELRGRHDDVLPRQLAELLVRERHAAHGARHARREIAGRRQAADRCSRPAPRYIVGVAFPGATSR